VSIQLIHFYLDLFWQKIASFGALKHFSHFSLKCAFKTSAVTFPAQENLSWLQATIRDAKLYENHKIAFVDDYKKYVKFL
jgi:hypothetical protein